LQEERRASLQKYQAFDEAMQVSERPCHSVIHALDLGVLDILHERWT